MLLESLAAQDRGTPLLLTPQGTLDAAHLCARVRTLKAALASRRNTAVAVRASQPLTLVLALLALDGLAARVLLLPEDTAPTLVRDLMHRAAVPASACLSDAELDLLADAPPATQADAPIDTQWVLATSGTTSTPKLVPHRMPTLAATVRRDATVGRALRWGLLYDPARYAGLQVVLQALLGGSALALSQPGQTLREQLALLMQADVNALSATPTLWRKMLMLPPADRALPLRVATLGGEIADQSVLDAVQRAWPQARVRHVYASTEAGVGFAVQDGLAGFPAAWLAEPPAGVELRIAGDAAQGELLLRSPRTARAYLNGVPLQQDDGWLGSGDGVRLDGARVQFLGRLNGSINVGGDKVFPETVEQVLREHPGVAAAAVQARASGITGALVQATIVPRHTDAEEALLRAALMQHCRERLPRAAVPALLRFVADIASSPAGKQARPR
jgi:acyl-CoA synthetase (AMP-forming)/AMP-acid ligase II